VKGGAVEAAGEQKSMGSLNAALEGTKAEDPPNILVGRRLRMPCSLFGSGDSAFVRPVTFEKHAVTDDCLLFTRALPAG
jgi:hypothetical protein